MTTMSVSRNRPTSETEYHTVNNLEFSVILYQGLKPTQDSAYMLKLHFLRRNQHLFALFDGHNGPEISMYCRRHLDIQIQQSFLYGDPRMHISLKQAFLIFDECLQEPKVKEDLKRIRNDFGTTLPECELNAQSTGSEVMLGIIKGKHLHIACLGDSRCLVIRKNQYLALYPNAKSPSDPPNKARTSHLLGSNLATRTTLLPGQLLPAEPEVFAYVIEPEDNAMVMFNRSVAKLLDDSSIAAFIRDKIDTKSVKEINEELIQFLVSRLGDKSAKYKESLALLTVKFSRFEDFDE